MQHLYPLKGAVQHYSWGGTQFLPQLLGINNDDKKPFAELWLGAHPGAPAAVQAAGKWVSLPQLIAEQPRELLGTDVAQHFNGLPYLLKVLDVQHMLSIQVHPTKAVAEKKFKEENDRGIAPNAAQRNYKDKNHKPELMVALSDFWLLHGFKPAAALNKVFEEVPELAMLQTHFADGDYKNLYSYVTTMWDEETGQLLRPLAQKIVPLYEAEKLQKSSPHFWAARALKHFCANGKYDKGIFSIYFFNLLQLKKGEGIYQAAGLPHAYLEGQNVEIMANSDNVLRAGLTDKWVDVPELLAQVQFAATDPRIIQPEQKQTFYNSPAEEFALSKYILTAGEQKKMTTTSAETFLVMEGTAVFICNDESVTLGNGGALLVAANSSLTTEASTDAVLFRAAVPRVGIN